MPRPTKSTYEHRPTAIPTIFVLHKKGTEPPQVPYQQLQQLAKTGNSAKNLKAARERIKTLESRKSRYTERVLRHFPDFVHGVIVLAQGAWYRFTVIRKTQTHIDAAKFVKHLDDALPEVVSTVRLSVSATQYLALMQLLKQQGNETSLTVEAVDFDESVLDGLVKKGIVAALPEDTLWHSESEPIIGPITVVSNPGQH